MAATPYRTHRGALTRECAAAGQHPCSCCQSRAEGTAEQKYRQLALASYFTWSVTSWTFLGRVEKSAIATTASTTDCTGSSSSNRPGVAKHHTGLTETLIRSMRRRCQAVINASGGHTCCWTSSFSKMTPYWQKCRRQPPRVIIIELLTCFSIRNMEWTLFWSNFFSYKRCKKEKRKKEKKKEKKD